MVASIAELAKAHDENTAVAQRSIRRLRSTRIPKATYPYWSQEAGCHPDQIEEMQQHLRERGCGEVEFNSEGLAKLTGPGQRKKVFEAYGMFDRNAGYSDPKPQAIHYEKERERVERIQQRRRERIEFLKELHARRG